MRVKIEFIFETRGHAFCYKEITLHFLTYVHDVHTHVHTRMRTCECIHKQCVRTIVDLAHMPTRICTYVLSADSDQMQSLIG